VLNLASVRTSHSVFCEIFAAVDDINSAAALADDSCADALEFVATQLQEQRLEMVAVLHDAPRDQWGSPAESTAAFALAHLRRGLAR